MSPAANLRLGNHLKQLREERKLTEIQDSDFEALKDKGIAAVKAGDFSRASLLFRTAYQRALEDESPANRTIQMATAKPELAVALRNAGRLDIAREEAEGAIEHAGLPVDLRDRIRINLATIYRRSRRTHFGAVVRVWGAVLGAAAANVRVGEERRAG